MIDISTTRIKLQPLALDARRHSLISVRVLERHGWSVVYLQHHEILVKRSFCGNAFPF